MLSTLQKIKNHREAVKKSRNLHRETFNKYQCEYYTTHPKRQEQVKKAVKRYVAKMKNTYDRIIYVNKEAL